MLGGSIASFFSDFTFAFFSFLLFTHFQVLKILRIQQQLNYNEILEFFKSYISLAHCLLTALQIEMKSEPVKERREGSERGGEKDA